MPICRNVDYDIVNSGCELPPCPNAFKPVSSIRYEDGSLSCAGIGKHRQDAQVGLFDTAIPAQKFEEM
ncbi:type III restriction endonuclease [Bifidobacterium avesanii]|nr:type III restriction endonuclease [Bifidobacterium avesanii]